MFAHTSFHVPSGDLFLSKIRSVLVLMDVQVTISAIALKVDEHFTIEIKEN